MVEVVKMTIEELYRAFCESPYNVHMNDDELDRNFNAMMGYALSKAGLLKEVPTDDARYSLFNADVAVGFKDGKAYITLAITN